MSAGRIYADTSLPGFDRVPVWLNDPENWKGPTGLLVRLREHIFYTGIVLVVAMLIAIPLGLFVGHTGRGVFLVVGFANALRAIPTFGLIVLLYVWLAPKINTRAAIPYLVDKGGISVFVPVMIVLVLLALPPLLTSTYAGVQNIDPAVRDAARGMGMTGWQTVRQVEIPNALPLIMSGIRSATLQVIATLTVAGFLPFLGGLGTFIKAGLGSIYDLQFGYPAMLSAGLMVALLAFVVDGLLNLLQRAVVSRGVSGRFKAAHKARPNAVSAEVSLADV